MTDKQIDLEPGEYRVIEEPRPEPFWGPGWPVGVGAVVAIVVGTLTYGGEPALHIFGAIAGAVVMAVVWQFYR